MDPSIDPTVDPSVDPSLDPPVAPLAATKPPVAPLAATKPPVAATKPPVTPLAATKPPGAKPASKPEITLEVFEGTSGLDTRKTARKTGVSLARTFDGSGKPIDGGPPVMTDMNEEENEDLDKEFEESHQRRFVAWNAFQTLQPNKPAIVIINQKRGKLLAAYIPSTRLKLATEVFDVMEREFHEKELVRALKLLY